MCVCNWGGRVLANIYLHEGELQTGGVVRQCEGENGLLVATVTAGPDPGGVHVVVPGLTHRAEIQSSFGNN